MNNDLTIILLLKGRNDFTVRWFRFAEKFYKPFKIIVADGGSGKSIKEKLNKLNLNKELNFEYIKYPYDSTSSQYFKKVLDALSRVSTKYVIFASNDDFYFHDSLLTSIKVLNKQKKFIASRGEIWDFSVSPIFKEILSKNQTPYYGEISGIHKLYLGKSISEKNSYKRVLKHVSNPESIWHDVIRTPIIKEAFAELLISKIYDLDLADKFISFYIVAKGGLHRCKKLYMLHQCHDDSISANNLTFKANEKYFSIEYQLMNDRFINKISKIISQIDKSNFLNTKYNLLYIYYNNFLIKKIINSVNIDKQFSFPRKLIIFTYNFFGLF